MNICELYKIMSLRQIAKKLNCSQTKIRNYLIKNNVKIRTAKEGVILHNKNSFPLSNELKQRINGELLGDGCLIKRSVYSCFVFTNKNKDYIDYVSNVLIDIPHKIGKNTYYHKNWKSYYTINTLKTHCSIEFTELEKVWYKNRKKIVPDIEISPNLVLHWYMGDGTLPKGKFAVFCSDCFERKEVEMLISKLNKEIGIKSSYYSGRIFVPKTSVPLLLEYIGNPPFNSISYKWDLQPIGKYYKKIDISYNELYKLYIKENLTAKQIAERFNCSSALIYKKVRQFEIRKIK